MSVEARGAERESRVHAHEPSGALAGATFVVLSAALFSAKAIFAKLAYRQGADPNTVLTLRMACALPFFAVVALRERRLAVQPLSRPKLWHVLSLGVFGYYLASLFDFLGLAYISAGLERLILFSYPTLVIAMGVLFRRERPSRQVGYAIAMSYAGIGLVVFRDHAIAGSDVWLGSGLVFAGAIAYAYYLAFSQPLIARHGSRSITSYVLVVACICVLTQFVIEGDYQRLAQPTEVYLLCAATGLFATVAPAFLLTAGIKRLGASRASLLSTVGPVVTLFYSYLFLDETLTPLAGAGASLVLLGVWLVTRERMPARADPSSGPATRAI